MDCFFDANIANELLFSRDAEPSLRGAGEREFGTSTAIALGFADCASRLNWILKLLLVF